MKRRVREFCLAVAVVLLGSACTGGGTPKPTGPPAPAFTRGGTLRVGLYQWDPTMPIDQTSRRFVPRLKTLGYDVTYREYEGRHQLPPEILRAVVEWFATTGR